MSELPRKRISKRKVYYEEEIILPQVPKKTKKSIGKQQVPKKKGRPRKYPLITTPTKTEIIHPAEMTEIEPPRVIESASPVNSPKQKVIKSPIPVNSPKQKQPPKENKSPKEIKSPKESNPKIEQVTKSVKKSSKETKQTKEVTKVKVKLPIKLSNIKKAKIPSSTDKPQGDKGFKCPKSTCSNDYLICFR